MTASSWRRTPLMIPALPLWLIAGHSFGFHIVLRMFLVLNIFDSVLCRGLQSEECIVLETAFGWLCTSRGLNLAIAISQLTRVWFQYCVLHDCCLSTELETLQ